MKINHHDVNKSNSQKPKDVMKTYHCFENLFLWRDESSSVFMKIHHSDENLTKQKKSNMMNIYYSKKNLSIG